MTKEVDPAACGYLIGPYTPAGQIMRVHDAIDRAGKTTR